MFTYWDSLIMLSVDRAKFIRSMNALFHWIRASITNPSYPFMNIDLFQLLGRDFKTLNAFLQAIYFKNYENFMLLTHKGYLMNPGASAFPVACFGISERLE